MRSAATITVDASEKPAQYLWLGAGVVIGFGCATIAALYPGLSSIWTAHGIDAVTRIAHHRDAWQVANWMTLRTAEGISHGEPVPDWYADITAWADDGLLSGAGLLFGASVVAYGIAVAVAEVAPPGPDGSPGSSGSS